MDSVPRSENLGIHQVTMTKGTSAATAWPPILWSNRILREQTKRKAELETEKRCDFYEQYNILPALIQ